ncbi:TIGR03943 family putative permease subunit [Bacillus sp. S/N-304-OC-R1]|uniref:TIGR03943 family putative permease subunit n=1 Tax=Bacillus sp. S/N-304-OC-R1 TaxID=2758034 RepID=UPI001C8E26CA|nr:TIGR03943 family protein [Bacillus sp. S/N-304-OC-R1]MBY0123708.1 TIGR03943 family protein [Bacillus sp. S/N-304-OC-R1]
MNFNFQQTIRAFILLTFSIFILKLHYTGEMTKYINPKYLGLSLTAAIIFIVLFFIQLTRIWSEKHIHHKHSHHEDDCCHHQDHACHHDHGETPFNFKKLVSYMIIVFPLLTGFLLPPKVLDASIANKKGGMAIITNQKEASENKGISEKNEEELTEPSEIPEPKNPSENSLAQEHLLDPFLASQEEMSEDDYEELRKTLSEKPNVVMEESVFSTYYEDIHMDIQKYKGKQIELTGFVYKEDDFEQDQVVLARFLITHCVADASIVGFLSEHPDASSMKTDTWIEAKGILDVTTYDGIELPLIKITSWKEIPDPQKPYIYPINVRLF